MTRCLSIIEHILKYSNYHIYIVCDKKQNNFAKTYLSNFEHRIMYKDIVTDIGFINKDNSLEVDKVSLEENLIKFVSSWDDIVNSEYEYLKSLDIKCIVNDISPVGCILGEKLNVDNFFISNFSWVEQYEHLNVDNHIVNSFKEAYSFINKFIKYDLCLPINTLRDKEVYDGGFVCRNIANDKVNDIRSEYGKSIFITCGKSANLNHINIKNFKGTIFTTQGIEIVCSKDCKVVELPIDILDTQNYIASSDIVITKAGWGTIAEAIIGHTSLVLIERPSAKEDSFNISEIKQNKLGISIKEYDLENIDILKLENELKKNIDYKKLNNYENDVKKVVDIIL